MHKIRSLPLTDFKSVVRQTSQLLKENRLVDGPEISALVSFIGKQNPQPFQKRNDLNIENAGHNGLVSDNINNLLEALAIAAVPQVHAMSVTDISHLLSGLSISGIRNDLLLDLSSREIGRQMHSTRIADLTFILHSYLDFQYTNEFLFEAISRRLILLLPVEQKIESKLLTSLSRSVSKMERSELTIKLQSVLATSIASRIDQFDALGLAESAHVFSQQKNAPFLLQVILDESFQRRSEFSNSSVALLVDAMGFIGHTGRRNSQKPIKVSDGKKIREIGIDGDKVTLLFDFFISDISKRGVGNFNAYSLALLARGLSKLSEKKCENNDTIFNKIGDRIASISNELTPFSIALLSQAFSIVNVRHGPLLFNLPLHLEAHIDEVSLEEMAAVMHAYASMGIRNDTLLRIVPTRTLSLMETSPIDVAHVVKLLEAYAMLVVSEKPLQNKLIEVLDNNLESIHDFSRIQNHIQTLQLDCPPKLASRLLV